MRQAAAGRRVDEDGGRGGWIRRRTAGGRAIFAALSLLVLVVTTPAPAAAEPPADLDGVLTDVAGVVDDPAAAEAALDDLQERGVQLWAVFVDTFDGLGRQEWARATAEQNGLGVNDALMAVAVEDRQYHIWTDPSFPVQGEDLARVATSQIEPALGNGDWTGAVVAAARGTAEALEGGAAAPGSGDRQPSGGGGLPAWLWAVPLLVLGIWLVTQARQRRPAAHGGTAAAPPPPPRESLEDLTRRADGLLVATDDAVEGSREELGFAEAQFGSRETATFREDLQTAQAELSEAFRMRQEAERVSDEAARRELLKGVLARAESADARLDAHVREFEQLRNLEANAPAVVAGLETTREATLGRVPEAVATLERLRDRYADTVTQPVAENPDEARQRLAAAGAAIDEARDALAAEDRSAAVLRARVAESAISQAARLLDAVQRLDADMDTVDVRLAELVAETRRDIDEAARAPEQLRAGLDPLVRDAQLALRAAEEERGAERPDPLAALRRLRAADDALESALMPVREAAQRAERARRQLDAAIAAARAEIAGVDDYIRTRRGAVGPEARTRLAAAQGRLDDALRLRRNDPEAALHAAQEADALAEEAARLSRHDRDTWSGPGRTGGVDIGSLILGGILLGGRGGGFGGGGHGGGGGFGGGGFGGGGFGGGFGGSGGGGVGGRF